MISLVEDTAASVIQHGFRRVILLNGHGGNNGIIDVLASKLGQRHYGRARIASITYFNIARDEIAELRESRPGGMGHACEFETAMMQHIRPDLVDMASAQVTYPDTGSRYLTTDLLGASAVRTYHDFGDLSPSGTLGDPSLATPEKGARFFEAVVGALVRFIEDFAKWTIPKD
jgi:creatinine amidohydrolase